MALNIHAIVKKALLAAPTSVRKAAVFTHVEPGAYDADSMRHSAPTTTTYTGTAVESPGNPERYARLQLVPERAKTLTYIPDTENSLPPLGSTITWGGVTYTLRDRGPIAPIGSAVAASLVVAV